MAVLLRLAVGFIHPLMGVLSPVIFGAAGYLAVLRFERLHRPLGSVWGGAGLGSLTGLLGALVLLVPQAFLLVAEGSEVLREQLLSQMRGLPGAAEVAKVFEDPKLFVLAVGFALVLEAAFLLAFASVGGAVAAKRAASR